MSVSIKARASNTLWRTRVTCASIALATILTGASSFAGPPNLRGVFAEYARTTWGPTDGAPDGAIYALAQDRDGRLWLGTEIGLYQFDGIRFASSSALGLDGDLGGPVQALHTSRDGSLWVGFGGKGGIYRVLSKAVRKFSATDDAPVQAVYTIVEDVVGHLWVGSEAGLYSFDGERWRRWRSSDGLPDTSVWGAHISSTGELFVTTARGIFSRSKDSNHFERIGGLSGFDGQLPTVSDSRSVAQQNALLLPRLPSDEVVRSITTDSVGRLYVSDWRFGFRMLRDRQAVSPADRGRGLQVLVDRHGNLWVATMGQGVWRFCPSTRGAPVTERITAHDGLGSEGGFALLEDRDGNIWVGGTPNGLTRLAPNTFLPLVHDDVVTSLAAMPSGPVWVGTSDALLEVSTPDAHPPVERRYLTDVSVRALHADASGTLWVATQRNILKISPGRPPVAVRTSDVLQQVDTITSHPRRGLFVSDRSHGLLRWNEAQGFTNIALPDSLRRARISTMYADSQARVWIAFANGPVAMLDLDDHVHTFNEKDGFDAGTYRIVHEDEQGVLWFGGTNGITRFKHDHGVTVRDGERLPIRRVKAIAHDRFGFLWIGVDNGILRIQLAELNTAASNSAFWPAYVLYDKSDGLAGLPRLQSDAMSVQTHGGNLWFVTGEGITVVNPDIQKNDGTPQMNIDRALVDDRQVVAMPNAQLPAGTRRIQLDYGAPNVTSAQKTRYRFRLDGVDSDWVNAGQRRQATYMNLPPGAYRFHVVATSSLGGWQDAGATWDFSIKPHFFQTIWFFVLCGSLVALSASFVWRFRLRMERNRFSVLLAERARVSREIHDTLLQGLVGLTLQCDALAQDVESAAPEISERLLCVRKQAQRYIKESRQAIWNLRFSARDHEPLPGALRGLGDIAAASHVKFSVVLKGSPRELSCDTEQQLVRIAREAVMNAIRHSGAHKITVELEYEPTQLAMRISDDGHGFVDTVERSDEHFGIVSMRERSNDIGASFSLNAAVGRGTVIEVVVSDNSGANKESESAAAV